MEFRFRSSVALLIILSYKAASPVCCTVGGKSWPTFLSQGYLTFVHMDTAFSGFVGTAGFIPILAAVHGG